MPVGGAGAALAGALGQNDKDKRRRYYQTHLFALATEILGYDRLTEKFHKPMLDEMDRMRAMRKLGRGKNRLDIWPRDHYKTTAKRAQVIQDYLNDPTDTIVWWHGVEEIAQESCEAIAKILQFNKEARKLFPEGVLPSPSAKRFISKKSFRLRSAVLTGSDSFSAFGAGSEATGAHGRHGYVDDVITFNDIQDSQIPAKKRWFGQTAMNVISTGGWFDGTGTRWDLEDMYADWLKNKTWVSITRSCYETDGKMDYNGEPVLFSREVIETKRANMTEAEFAFQMMNDPSPSSEKPWDQLACEHMVKLKEVAGPGAIVALSDPAPANVGDLIEDKKLGGTEKNYWVNAIVKVRRNGQRRELVLLDMKSSKEWEVDEGFRILMEMMRKWHGHHVAVEKTGQAVAFYEKTIREQARMAGVRYTPIDLTMTYQGKNAYFAKLASIAKKDEFLIADTVPQAELDLFLSQARAWRAIGKKNNLKFDDHANCASFGTDPEIMRLAPVPMDNPAEWSPFRAMEEESELQHNTGYISW